MPIGLVLVLLAGFLLMCMTIAQQMKWYQIPIWKSSVISFTLVLDGLIGSHLWYFVENFSFGGRSFYGAIFLAPLIYWPVSRYLKVPYDYALDFCAPSGCLTLALVKIQCLRDNCCMGKFLYIDENHMFVFFPSQLVEMANFIILAVVLFFLSKKKSNHGKIFPIFLIFYGGTRFILDFFRGETTPYLLGLTAGSFWSACAFVIGIIWLCIANTRKSRCH